MFPNQKENLKLSGLGLGLQGELPPVPAAGKDLPPLVEGGDTRCEHDVELLKQAEPARLAGGVVTSQLLLQEVPGDGEAGACPP